MNLEHKLVKAKDCTGIQINERKDMKVKEAKKSIQEFWESSKRVALNAEHFVQAVSLLATAGFSFYARDKVELDAYAYYFITVALVVIGLRGTYELLKFLNKEK